MQRILLSLILITSPIHSMHYLKSAYNWLKVESLWGEPARAAQLIKSGDIEQIKWCLENGADPNMRYHFQTINGETITSNMLRYAIAMQSKHEIIELLLKHGANPNQIDTGDPQNKYLLSPLLRAALLGDAALCKLLIQYGANPNITNESGWTPLMVAATYKKHEVCKLLIELNANINKPCVKGFTPLAYAARDNHDRICELLLEHGAIPSQEDSRIFKNYLRDALEYEDDDRAKLLLRCGADATDPICTLGLIDAAQIGDFQMCRLLLERGADPKRNYDPHGIPLMFAATLGHAPICALLIEYGADVNQADEKNGLTPRGIAAAYGHDRICELLTEHGAIASKKDRYFLANSLVIAAADFDLERCKLLIDCGAFLHHAIGAPLPILSEEVPNPDPATRRQKTLEETACPPLVKDNTITNPGARDALGYALAPLEQADLVALLLDAGAHCSYNQYGHPRVMRILHIHPTLLKKVCYAPNPETFHASFENVWHLLWCLQQLELSYTLPKDLKKMLVAYCAPKDLGICMTARAIAGKRIEQPFQKITLAVLYSATIKQLKSELIYAHKNMGQIMENYNPANHNLAVTAETIEERYGKEIRTNIEERVARPILRCNNVILE